MGEIEYTTIKGKQYYGVKALSQILGIRIFGIRDYLRKGKIKGIKIGRHWMVSEENLDRFLNGN